MMEKILETLKKVFGSVKGIIGLLVALIGAILLFRENFELTIIVLIILIELIVLVVYIIIWSEKAQTEVKVVEISVPKYPKLRRFGWIVLLIIIMFDLWFIRAPRGKEFLSKAIKWGSTEIATETTPRFEINFIGLPFEGDNTYYVTNNLIGLRGDLREYDDFVLSPLKVEIVPHYSGEKNYGNVVLRVLGDDSTKDYPLWPDFNKPAQTQTVELTLAEIIEVSGIRYTYDDINSNLMLGDKPYQEATLKFEVIRLSEPDKPFDSIKELPVKNTPWKQETSIVDRDDLALDYALTNFGGDAIFSCNITVAKTLSDVTENDHDFWSGIDVFSYDLDCDTFTVRTGETYKTTFPLNEDTLGEEFTHGRYLVQVYSFPERKDVVFNEGYSFDHSNDLWLFADPGDLETFVICNDPGLSCEETDTLFVQEIATKTYPFYSDELDNGATYFQIRSYPVNNHSTNQYILNYWIDPTRDGWVGFGIEFENLLDVSEYKSIRFNLTLDESAHPVWFDVEYRVGDEYKTSRIEIGTGDYGEASPDEQTVVVPFSAFTGVDWAKVDTINFVLDSHMVPDDQEHEIQVSEIEFIR